MGCKGLVGAGGKSLGVLGGVGNGSGERFRRVLGGLVITNLAGIALV